MYGYGCGYPGACNGGGSWLWIIIIVFIAFFIFCNQGSNCSRNGCH